MIWDKCWLGFNLLYGQWLIDELNLHKEAVKREKELDINKTLVEIIQNIETYKQAFININTISITNSSLSPIEKEIVKNTIQILDTHTPTYNELLILISKINIPSSLLYRLFWLNSNIKAKYALFKDQLLYVNKSNIPVSEFIVIFKKALSTFSLLRLFQVQLGCYIKAEAIKHNTSNIAFLINEAGLLKPTSDMSRFVNIGVYVMGEPDDDCYAECKLEYLISIAKEIDEQTRRNFMNALQPTDEGGSINELFEERPKDGDPQ